MAKNKNRNRSEDAEAVETTDMQTGFAGMLGDKGGINKPVKITTAASFTEKQTLHLDDVAEAAGISRSEFVRRAVVYALNDLGKPFPGGDLSDEERGRLRERQAKWDARFGRERDEE